MKKADMRTTITLREGLTLTITGGAALPALMQAALDHCLATLTLPAQLDVTVFLKERNTHYNGVFVYAIAGMPAGHPCHSNRANVFCGNPLMKESAIKCAFVLAHELGHAQDHALGTLKGRTVDGREAYANAIGEAAVAAIGGWR